MENQERTLAIESQVAPELFGKLEENLKLIAPDSLKTQNSLENPDLVKTINGEIFVKDSSFLFTLPKWSIGVVQFKR